MGGHVLWGPGGSPQEPPPSHAPGVGAAAQLVHTPNLTWPLPVPPLPVPRFLMLYARQSCPRGSSEDLLHTHIHFHRTFPPWTGRETTWVVGDQATEHPEERNICSDRQPRQTHKDVSATPDEEGLVYTDKENVLNIKLKIYFCFSSHPGKFTSFEYHMIRERIHVHEKYQSELWACCI